MKLDLYQIDAFTDKIFGGNPACVIPLSDWLPDEVLLKITKENAGLAIAAYERTLLPTESPFQNWLHGEEDAMTDPQKMGAILFFSKGKCNTCHTGPALSSMDFYALGMKDLHQNDYNDAFFVNEEDSAHKGRGGFTGNLADMYKFKHKNGRTAIHLAAMQNHASLL